MPTATDLIACILYPLIPLEFGMEWIVKILFHNNRHEGASTSIEGVAVGGLKNGIVRRFSGVGPAASIFFRARSV
jgi:hypothetical protein